MGGESAKNVPEAFLIVRVKPRSAQAGLLGRHGSGIKVAVRAAPEHGRANAELVRVVAAALGVPATALAVASGTGAPDKRLRITGMDAAELERRLAAALQE